MALRDIKNTVIPMKKATASGDGQNEYYLKISRKFRLAKYITFFMLIIFIVIMITSFGENITVENLRYVLKYIDTQSSTPQSGYQDIQYGATSGNFALYKGDLVVVDTMGLHIYDRNSKTLLSSSFKYVCPTVLVSDKYILVYDLGGTSYSVFNSFGLVYEETLDYPISHASISPDGTFIISTRTKEYRSAVYFYNKDFKRAYSWYSADKYVIATSILSDGSKFLISSVSASRLGNFTSQILVCSPSTEDKQADIILEDEAVMGNEFFKDGAFASLGNSALRFYDPYYKQTSVYGFSTASPNAYYSSSEYECVMLAFKVNIVGNENNVIFWNSKGEQIYNGTINGDVIDLVFAKNCAYILTDNSVVLIDFNGQKQYTYSLELNARRIFAVDDGTILVCYSTRAQAYNTSEIFFY
ncbi:MAG: hypothetical protein J5922_03820 [Clostridia bacterium]|nr:hypothetical protein [Clostridia bacterium]